MQMASLEADEKLFGVLKYRSFTVYRDEETWVKRRGFEVVDAAQAGLENEGKIDK
jgi:hypothetical protein